MGGVSGWYIPYPLDIPYPPTPPQNHKSRQYTSYWNAFLFMMTLLLMTMLFKEKKDISGSLACKLLIISVNIDNLMSFKMLLNCTKAAYINGTNGQM